MADTEVEHPQTPIKSIYRSAEGERQLQENYDLAINSLPFTVEKQIVETSWGKAHVLVAGPEDGIPLFLWQGTAAPGPFMLDLFSSLVPKYRVFAPDHPCQGKPCLASTPFLNPYWIPSFPFITLFCSWK